MSKSDERRVEVLEQIKRIAKGSLKLAFVLADLQETKEFQKWGAKSLAAWFKQENLGLSRGYLYSLTKIGRVFKPYQMLVETTEKPIREVIDLVYKVEQGMPVELAVANIIRDEPIPDEYLKKDASTDPEGPQRLTVFIPRGDYDQALVGATLYAIRHGHKTFNEAYRGMSIDQSFDASLPAGFEKYLEVIYKGKFKCRLCEEIPTQPTMHHVLPRSICQGWGPVELLCWEPCHNQIVQPKWKLYGTRWGHDLAKLLREYATGIANGTISGVDPEANYPRAPTEGYQASAPAALVACEAH